MRMRFPCRRTFKSQASGHAIVESCDGQSGGYVSTGLAKNERETEYGTISPSVYCRNYSCTRRCCLVTYSQACCRISRLGMQQSRHLPWPSVRMQLEKNPHPKKKNQPKKNKNRCGPRQAGKDDVDGGVLY